MAALRLPLPNTKRLSGVAIMLAFCAALVRSPAPPNSSSAAHARVGFTFSQQQTTYMGIAYQDAYHALMGLRPPIVRLAVYWNRTEPQPRSYDFSVVDWLIANTPPATSIILVVGMKAPRWPEFYIPPRFEQANNMPERAQVSDDMQLQTALLQFDRAVVLHYRDSPRIAYWQVENEPLDPSGPRQWTIGSEFLAREVGLVRKHDGRHRPVLVNTFVSTNPARQVPGLDGSLARRVHQILSTADILGLDVYPVRAHEVFGQNLFFRWPAFIWQRQLRAAHGAAQSAGKEVWVSEAQAEPWLVTELVYLRRLPSPEITPSETDFLVEQLRADGFQTVLLWGAEYWYMRLQRYGDSHWWAAMRPLFD